MNRSRHLVNIIAVALTVMTLSAVSAIADSRHQDGTSPAADDRYARVAYRDNDRVTLDGRIESMTRERDGFRVRLAGNGYSFWVPERAIRNRENFRVGVSIRFGGIFRGGLVTVDAVDWINADNRGYDDHRSREIEFRHVVGIVERVDRRREVMFVRDEATGRLTTIDMLRTDEHRGWRELDDFRRGDRVDLAGEWSHSGTFRAFRVERLPFRRH